MRPHSHICWFIYPITYISNKYLYINGLLPIIWGVYTYICWFIHPVIYWFNVVNFSYIPGQLRYRLGQFSWDSAPFKNCVVPVVPKRLGSRTPEPIINGYGTVMALNSDKWHYMHYNSHRHMYRIIICHETSK